ncbi:MAG: hypothetical protein M1833_005328 [Piccolia ochrophora]|nr:MAG: hypothetical protein M1833_005328 [Piccolia ochrophora]
MSTAAKSDPTQSAPQPSKSKKGNKKKKSHNKSKSGDESARVNGLTQTQDQDSNAAPTEPTPLPNGVSNGGPTSPAKPPANDDLVESPIEDKPSIPRLESLKLQGEGDSPSSGSVDPETEDEAGPNPQKSDPLSILEQGTLHQEVSELRNTLEDIQRRHEQELSAVRDRLDEAQSEKEHAEMQYRNLLGKLNTIRSQLGDRLKADAEELSQARTQIDELEDSNKDLKHTNKTLESRLSTLTEEGEQRSKEISTLRNRTNLSQQNWSKERDDLIGREAFAREEFEAAKQAMQDWEVLAMEERSIRETLGEKVSELEEQLSAQREAHDKAASDRDNQSLAVDGLQRALQDIQDARKQELRELVENNQTQVETLRKQLQEVEKSASESQTALETARADLESAIPFEKEVKEKNLLIGKLRHEAVILNDHLTKALRFLKKGKPEDNVDRQIVTNHFLHFLALDRADPKKFQVLQLIAALLNWTDEQRETAGLSRPGASNSSLRTPLSPFSRTPSTPALSSNYFTETPTNTKESLAELWSDFLEQEAHEGSKQQSRSASMSGPSKPAPRERAEAG